MLGGYISKKLTGYNGDPVSKEVNNEIIGKINELVIVANNYNELIKNKGINSLSENEISQIKNLLHGIGDSLPSDTEMQSIETKK